MKASKTSPPMELRRLTALCVNIFIWYYASTISATSSQSFVESLQLTQWLEEAFAMILVTFLQMVTGTFLGVSVAMVILRWHNEPLMNIFTRIGNRFRVSPGSRDDVERQKLVHGSNKHSASANSSYLSLRRLFFPSLHAAGSVFTNLGYAFSSASFVQIIKLTEPIQTMILDVVLRKLWGIPRQKIKVSIACFVSGTALVFFGRNRSASITDIQASYVAILMVILSGFFLSSRNVLKKIIHHKDTPGDSGSTSTETHATPIGMKIMEGLDDFIHLSLGGATVLLPVTLLAFSICVYTGSDVRVLSSILSSIVSYFIMVLSHSIYNVASLLVLSFVAAPVHSLLNSGKRLSSTLMVMLWFGEDITPEIILGFLFITVAVIPSLTGKQRALMVALAAGVYVNVRHMRLLDAESSDVYIVGKTDATDSVATVDRPTGNCKVKFKDENMKLCHFIPYNGNFGDELGPAVILKLLENRFKCSIDEVTVLNLANAKRRPNDVCLFSLGSIFHMIRSGDHIWGTGINPSRQKSYDLKNLTFYSVRGPKTEAIVREKFGVEGKLGLGDPGFLVPYLYPKYRIAEKTAFRALRSLSSGKARICFVPHAQDMDYDELKRLPPENIISLKNTWRPVGGAIMGCDYVASSSLHGIVVANAIGIPTLWFQFKGGKTSQTEGTFKYEDYFTSINRMNEAPVSNFDVVFDPTRYKPAIPAADRQAITKRTVSSFPYQLFTTYEADILEAQNKTLITTSQADGPKPRNKTLVIIMGTLRGGEGAWQSFYKNMLEPNSADLALLVPRNTSRTKSSLFEHSKYVWEHDEYDDWGVAIDKIIGGDRRWRHIAAKNNETGLLGGVKESPLGSGAIIFLLRVFVMQNIVSFGLDKEYDRFVLTRSDHYYSCLHDLSKLDSKYMWVPEGEEYHGVTDRHLVCNSTQILKALNILQPVVLKPNAYWDFHGNPEALIMRRWKEERLWRDVRRFKRMMFTCAVAEDSTRWQEPDTSNLVPEGVYLKYPKEYALTQETCKK